MKRCLPFFLFLIVLRLYGQEITVVSEGYITPVGIQYVGNEAQDLFIVTEAGSGNVDGQINLFTPGEAPIPAIGSLPSWLNPDNGEVTGPWRIGIYDTLLVVVEGEGPDSLGESLLFYDLAAFYQEGILAPTAVKHAIKIGSYARAQGAPNSNPYSMALDQDGFIYVVDAGFNGILKIDPIADTISTFTIFPDFPNPTDIGPPMINSVPSKILSVGDTSFLVGTFTGFPFVEGSAKIYSVSAEGAIADFVTGLTMVIDLAVDPTDGNLVALQFASFGPMGFEPNSAQLIKIMPDLSLDTLVSGLGPSGGFTFDLAGNAYVTSTFTGQVLKITPSETTSIYEIPTCDCALEVNPNPVQDQAAFSFNLPESGNMTLRVYTAMGGIVTTLVDTYRTKGDYTENWQLDSAILAKGIYMGVLTINGKVQVTKFIKQ